MKVLSVASESVPLIKTGGLADVVGALPRALEAHGVEMRVLLPAYQSIRGKISGNALWQSDSFFGGSAAIYSHKTDGIEFLLLDAPHLFDRDGGPYNNAKGDYPDNALRFGAFCQAAVIVADGALSDGWKPDLVHAHDWQAGLVPAYLKLKGSQVPSIMTVHNIAFQGLAGPEMLRKLGLPKREFHSDALEYWGQLSTLKAGLVYANAITTVSPTYADELKTQQFGMGLEGVIRSRSSDLYGILNGVDEGDWNPESGEGFSAYSATKMAGKTKNRAALLEEFGLRNIEGPLAIVVSRLSDQKGMDLLIDALPRFFEQGGGLCLLGSGDVGIESNLKALSQRYTQQFGLRIGYDENLSKRMFAGGDAVLVPSRFEPCGLTQLYGLKFGTLPVVSSTGGLADTVIHANAVAIAAGVATGICFSRIDSLGLSDALGQLNHIYRDKSLWKLMQKNAMTQGLGWEVSAKKYLALYEEVLK